MPILKRYLMMLWILDLLLWKQKHAKTPRMLWEKDLAVAELGRNPALRQRAWAGAARIIWFWRAEVSGAKCSLSRCPWEDWRHYHRLSSPLNTMQICVASKRKIPQYKNHRESGAVPNGFFRAHLYLSKHPQGFQFIYANRSTCLVFPGGVRNFN